MQHKKTTFKHSRLPRYFSVATKTAKYKSLSDDRLQTKLRKFRQMVNIPATAESEARNFNFCPNRQDNSSAARFRNKITSRPPHAVNLLADHYVTIMPPDETTPLSYVMFG